MRFKTSYSSDQICDSVRRRFSEYLDGVLGEEERREIHNHLKFCKSCSQDLDRLCKTLSVLAEYRQECTPESILNFRLPRSTFYYIFPTIQEDPPPRTWGVVVPYVYALLFFFLLATGWEFAYHTFDDLHNASNWVEVVAKI